MRITMFANHFANQNASALIVGSCDGLPWSSQLAPLFTNANAPWRSALLIEGPVTRFDIPAKRYTGVRTLTKKYIKYDGGFEELFDLSTDPHELTNEARKASDNAALPDLRAVHNKLKSCSGASCRVP